MQKLTNIFKFVFNELFGEEPPETTRLIQCGDLFRNRLMKQINSNPNYPLELKSVTWFDDLINSIDTPPEFREKVREWLNSQEQYSPRLLLEIDIKAITNNDTLPLDVALESFDRYAKNYIGDRDYEAEKLLNNNGSYKQYIVYKFLKAEEQ